MRESTHVRIYMQDLRKLAEIKTNCGFKNSAAVLHTLLEQQARNLASVDAVMDERVPVVLCGKPLSGKSYFIKNRLLPFLAGNPVLVIDVQNEYDELRSVSFDIFGLDFANCAEHLRFVPNRQSMVAESEISSLFANLEMKRDQLARWIIVAEEAQSFKSVASFVRFVYGSRHIVRKFICVTPQLDAFQGLATLNILR